MHWLWHRGHESSLHQKKRAICDEGFRYYQLAPAPLVVYQSQFHRVDVQMNSMHCSCPVYMCRLILCIVLFALLHVCIYNCIELSFVLLASVQNMGFSRNLVVPKDLVNIDLWQNCLAAQPGVVSVQPVLKTDGTSRKCVVEPKVLASDGGHWCPYELYVYIGKTTKKMRIIAGLTNHGGVLHVYCREFSEQFCHNKVKNMFYNATTLVEEKASPMAPQPSKLIGIPTPPSRPIPLPPTPAKLVTTPPLPPPLVAYDLTAEYNFDAKNYGHEYISLI